MQPSPLERYYFEFLTYHEPDGVSLQTYCENKGILYAEMSAWLKEIKRNADDMNISPEKRERINDIIYRLVHEVRAKDALGRELDRLIAKK